MKMRHSTSLIRFVVLVLVLTTLYEIAYKLPTISKITVTEKKVFDSYLVTDAPRPDKPEYCFPIPPKIEIAQNDSPIDYSQPHVVMSDGGKLGNQICQYSALWILKKYFGIKVVITNEMMEILSSLFEEIHIESSSTYKTHKNTTRHLYGFDDIKYDDLYIDLVQKNSQLMKQKNVSSSQRGRGRGLLDKSYFISNNPCPLDLLWLYRDQLRKELVIKSSLLDKAKTKINDILRSMGKTRENITLVTVHVRRDDYVGFLQRVLGAEPISEHFYERAFEFYRKKIKNPIFLVMSDDPKWCSDHFQSKDIKIAASPDHLLDYALLTLGDHHIRGVGTYTFTSALLGQGGMVYPVNYSQKTAMMTKRLGCVLNSEELVPIDESQGLIHSDTN